MKVSHLFQNRCNRDTGLVKINNKKNWNERLNILKNNIDEWIDKETEKTIKIIPLFYDEN
jgi:Holliday junction resolvasome RuvABC endonuclease subunit